MSIYPIVRMVTRRLYVRGLPSLLWRARDRLRTLDGTYQLQDGLRMRISADDYFQWMMVWGYYQPEIVALLDVCLRRGDVCIDVGGHIGFVTLNAALRVGTTGRVVVAEPDPRARCVLMENIELNNARQVTVVEAAVAAEMGKREFHLATQVGWSTAVPSGAPMVVEETITVDTVTIDSLIRDHLDPTARVRLVKIDIEGFEVEALLGARGLITAATAAFLVEVNPATLRANGRTVHEVLEPFRRANYRIFTTRRSRAPVRTSRQANWVPVRTDNVPAGDVLALPPGFPGNFP